MPWNGSERRDEGDRIEKLEQKVDRLSDSVEGLVTAWKTAGGLVRFVKWSSGFIIGLGIIWKFFFDK